MIIGKRTTMRPLGRIRFRSLLSIAISVIAILAPGLQRVERAATASEAKPLRPVGFISVGNPTDSDYWEFPSGTGNAGLVRLPAVISPLPTADELLADLQADSLPGSEDLPVAPKSADTLQLKLPSDDSPYESTGLADTLADTELPLPIANDNFDVDSNVDSSVELEVIKAPPETLAEEDLEASPTGALTDKKVIQRAQTLIHHGYTLADRGAYFAARSKFVEALRLISQAKDKKHGSARRIIALAEGFRALDEAEDYAPRGMQFEAELEIDVISASHRTPVAREAATAGILPQQMMDRYLLYAQKKLAGSVAGEPAGSMALHALGKLYSRLDKIEPEKHLLAQRQAVVFQQAALLAHKGNYLAAHELGVLMARTGHLAEAEILLKVVSNREPSPIVYRNLAQVLREQGNHQQAEANRLQAQQLTQQKGAQPGGVQWVSTERFASAQNRLQRPPQRAKTIPTNQPRFSTASSGGRFAPPRAMPPQQNQRTPHRARTAPTDQPRFSAASTGGQFTPARANPPQQHQRPPQHWR